MDDLVRWLRAQLDVDAARAQACPGNGEWTAEDIAVYGADLSPEVRTHMAEHDPARVLREIDAKRKAVDHYSQVFQHAVDGADSYVKIAAALSRQLRIMASVYADRPGYREAWRP
jgi:hypothetical protein